MVFASGGRERIRERKGQETGPFQKRDRVGNQFAMQIENQQAKELIGVCFGIALIEPEGRAGIGMRGKQAPLSGNGENARPK